MNAEEWAAWVSYHRNLFYLHTEEDRGMFAAWKPIIIRENPTLDELKHASATIATEKGGAFRSAHLEMLLRFITAQRRERERQLLESTERANMGAECGICRNTGLVVVPHLRSMVNDQWVYPWYTFGVACRCFRGDRLVTTPVDKRSKLPATTLMRLASYEQRVPQWPELLERREREREEFREAKALAGHVDRQHGRVAIEEALKKLRNGDKPTEVTQ